MNSKLKKIIIILSILLIIVATLFISILIYRNIRLNNNIKDIEDTYSTDNIQNRINEYIDSDSQEILDLTEKIDGNNIVGVLVIDKINFKGLVAEGTDLPTLKNYVGHFSSSPFYNGNVCFAAHNTNNFWARLKELSNGDTIEYISFLGTRKYEVFNVQQIEETDFSLLSNTDNNIVTLITCVKNNKPKRLCVQAKEVY